MKKPLVSVIMSVYNGQNYVAEAIDSILSQTLADFEFIIIDDGSADKTSQILEAYAKKDTRIKLVNQENQGLVASLNRGIKMATGKYIARQDADDRSDPSRLTKQVEFLTAHPNVAIVGSNISVMDGHGKVLHQHAVLLHDPELRQELLVRSPFAHGSVIFRRQAALKAGLYKQNAWPAEDYDFWLRLSQYGQLANLDEPLYIYREHGQSISEQNTQLQQIKTLEVQAKAWQQYTQLLPKQKIKLSAYKNRSMGQLRIQRILANQFFVAKKAWSNQHKSLAIKNVSGLASRPVTYKKFAGRIKRRILSK